MRAIAGVMIDPGRQARQPDHSNRTGETRDTCNGIVQFNGVTFAFADDDRGDGQLALRQHVERGERMADGTEIAADHEQ